MSQELSTNTSTVEILAPTTMTQIEAPVNAMQNLLLTLQETMNKTVNGEITTGQAFAVAKVASVQTKAIDLAFRIYREAGQ